MGTLPPPRFSLGKLRATDVNFCYGSCDGLLWPILDKIFQLRLRFDNSEEAVRQRQDFLRHEKLGICDIVDACWRDKVDASDLGMHTIKLRDIVEQLYLQPTIETLIFTGGNTKNGPEFLFRRQLKEYHLKLVAVTIEPPREHRFLLKDRSISTISLISPSKTANRSIGSNPQFKNRRKENPGFTPFDFRLEQYKKIFQS